MAFFNPLLPNSTPASRGTALLRVASRIDASENRAAETKADSPGATLIELDKVTLNQGLQGLAEEWQPTSAQIEEISFPIGSSRHASPSASFPSSAIQMLAAEIVQFGDQGLDAALSATSAVFAPAFLQSVEGKFSL